MTSSARVRRGCPAPPCSSLCRLRSSVSMVVNWEGLTLLPLRLFQAVIRRRISLHRPIALETKLLCLDAVDKVLDLKATVTVFLIIGKVVPLAGLLRSTDGMLVCRKSKYLTATIHQHW